MFEIIYVLMKNIPSPNGRNKKTQHAKIAHCIFFLELSDRNINIKGL